MTSGSLNIGDTVKISYVDQNRAGLDPNKNLWEAVSDGLDFIEVAGVEVPTRAYVASFGFKGSDQQKLVGVLSGGERNRLNLALTLKQGGNLLLLDEPTNDLDVETLESLENALLAFPGCAGQLVLVRRQLPGLSGEPHRPSRRGCGPPAPPAPQADPLRQTDPIKSR